MTDNEIIKALECCIISEEKGDCTDCTLYVPFNGSCQPKLFRHAIDLINRQQAEIKRLHKENERLTDKLDEQQGLKAVQVEAIKAEAIQDFAERLCHTLERRGKDCIEDWELEDYCTYLVEEMTEDEGTFYCVDNPCECEKLSNYERIKAMSVEEMTELLEHIYPNYDNTRIIIDGVRMDVAKIKQWLESEVNNG